MTVNSLTVSDNNVSSNKRVIAKINLGHLRYNLARVKQLAINSKIISVIKADAYGHGMFPIAKALAESDILAVARFDEALELRQFLLQEKIDKAILILQGVFSNNELCSCVEHNFMPNIHSLEQLKTLRLFFKQHPQLSLNYWLKVDTGMHRLGLNDDDWSLALKDLKSLDSQHQAMGVMSHFACADEINNPLNQQQLSKFEDFYVQLDKLTQSNKSMANSAAILSLQKSYFDWVRPGIMLYGVSPFAASEQNRTALDEQLKPVMTLSSEIIAIKTLKQGDCIGYGSTWCCPEDMQIGIVAIGYGDGYPRHAQAGTPVLLHGIEVPLVGRVSMDMISIDLRYFFKKDTPQKNIQLGDKVILWGEHLAIEKIAKNSATIAYELLCQLTPRVHFQYIENT